MSEQKIVARISALMAKTEDAGATEDEALAAAEKARELIDRYQIDLRKVAAHSEAHGRSVGVDKRVFRSALRKLRLHEVKWLFSSIGKYCDVVIFFSKGLRNRADAITIVGEPLDCRMAYFMISNLRSALDRAYSESRIPVNKRSSYLYGACIGIGTRIDEMRQARSQRMASSGTDLVATKSRAAQAEAERLYPKARTQKNRAREVDCTLVRGLKDGQGIPIQQGVEESAGAPRLNLGQR